MTPLTSSSASTPTKPERHTSKGELLGSLIGAEHAGPTMRRRIRQIRWSSTRQFDLQFRRLTNGG